MMLPSQYSGTLVDGVAPFITLATVSYLTYLPVFWYFAEPWHPGFLVGMIRLETVGLSIAHLARIPANSPSVSRSRAKMSARISFRERMGWGL